MSHEPTAETPDEILVLQAQHGDGVALDALVQRYQKRVWRHCLVLLGDEDAAWDAAQETFLTMLREIRGLRHAAAFPLWIHRLATARVRDLQRGASRLRRLEEIWAQEKPADSINANAPQKLQLSDCLSLLSPEDRTLINLRYMEGFSTRETAAILYIPEGTVKSRLSAIRQRLRHLTGEPET